MASKTNTAVTADNAATAAVESKPAYAGGWRTEPLVATKANGRTKDPLKLALASEGAVRGAHLRAYLDNGGSVKTAAATLGVSVSRIRALVDGPTIKARYALRMNPAAVFRGMDPEELDSLRALLEDMGAGEVA